jgi:glycosyltransferase involved in cell wall biosynthesis
MKSKSSTNNIMVSVCTPTFNRRPFIPAMLECFNHQTYPRECMEWIIIDDGTDPIEDLVSHHECVRYFKFADKMSLGKKRNLMHEKARGEIIVYMDDDDYYPPERVSHAVETLLHHRKRRTGIKLVGSSEMCIYFKCVGEGQMVQFGPYGPNHATAATFAFWKELLSELNLAYEESACLAEERAFLRGYTVPMAQLDPMKVILVFSHEHNTFDKRGLLKNMDRDQNMRVSSKTVSDFIKEPALFQFYMHEVDAALKLYEPGHPSMKPDVMQQINERLKTQGKKHQDAILKALVTFKAPNAEPRTMTVEELIQTVQSQAEKLKNMRELCNKKIRENSVLLATIKDRDEVIAAHLETIERQGAMLDAQHPTPNTEHLTPNTEHLTPKA